MKILRPIQVRFTSVREFLSTAQLRSQHLTLTTKTFEMAKNTSNLPPPILLHGKSAFRLRIAQKQCPSRSDHRILHMRNLRSVAYKNPCHMQPQTIFLKPRAFKLFNQTSPSDFYHPHSSHLHPHSHPRLCHRTAPDIHPPIFEPRNAVSVSEQWSISDLARSARYREQRYTDALW